MSIDYVGFKQFNFKLMHHLLPLDQTILKFITSSIFLETH